VTNNNARCFPIIQATRVKRVDLSGGGMILALAQVATGERFMLCRARGTPGWKGRAGIDLG
jgi:hypothetical protein